MAARGAPLLGDDPLVDTIELDPVDLLAHQEGRVARIDDLDLLQHLADDHLDMLVDLSTLVP